MKNFFKDISNNTVNELFLQSPLALGMLMGEDLIVEVANPEILKLWRKDSSIIGLPLIKALPELEGQPFIDILKKVLHTGIPYHGERVPVAIQGKEGIIYPYFNFVYAPIRNTEERIIGVSVSANEVTEQIHSEQQLEVSESLYKSIITESEVPTVLFKGEDLIVEIINDRAREIWGKEYDVKGMKLEDALPELQNQPFIHIIKNVFRTGEVYKEEAAKVNLSHNGQLLTFYINLFYKPIKNSDGSTFGVLNMGLDVTAQINQQALLEKSEKRLRQVIDSVPMAMTVLKGPEFIIEMSNQINSELWKKHAERIGKKVEDIYPELRDHKIMDYVKEAYNTGKEVRVQEMPIDFPGMDKQHYVNYIIRPLDTDKNNKTIIAVGFDVTEELIMKEKLKTSENNFKELANSVPQIVWTATPGGDHDYFNERWYEYSGYPKDINKNSAWTDIIYLDDRDIVFSTWKNALHTGKDFEIEYRFKDTDETNTKGYRWFLIRAVAVKNKNNQIIKWIGTSTDIDDFKELQKQKDTFLGIASHELKTPLTSLKLYTNFIEKNLRLSGDTKNVNVVVKMNEQINKLNTLITDLLDVTKIQNGKIVMNEDVFDFDELIDNIIEEQQMSSRHHLILKKSSPVIGTVKADRERIAQVMSNLINNAIKYSPDADKIILYANANEHTISFAVEDFGIGIPEKKLQKVFDQYYRVIGNDENTYPGLGLGLYISSEIINRSGGKMFVNSTEGKGSVFSFELPKNN